MIMLHILLEFDIFISFMVEPVAIHSLQWIQIGLYVLVRKGFHTDWVVHIVCVSKINIT